MGQMVKSPMNRLQKNLMNLHGNLRWFCYFDVGIAMPLAPPIFGGFIPPIFDGAIPSLICFMVFFFNVKDSYS